MTPDAARRTAPRPPRRLLIANRGEIAIRIARTAAELGIETVAVHSRDDAASLHTRKADTTHALDADGPAAYLDAAAIVAAARATGCDAVHPGYGFLSESAAFAQACADAGLVFVGPQPRTLALFGDKAAARAHAVKCGVPVLAGTDRATTLEEARAFLRRLGDGGAMMLKALHGGGGRGIRPVTDPQALDAAWARCGSEAAQAFGDGALYVERLMPRARHVEVQVAGDGAAAVHLWERECSLQRQRQKLVEIAPAPGLSPGVRDRLLAAALRMAREAGLANLATIEFLVDADGAGRNDGEFAFVEANPRLQVEHTVTEELLGIDLVRLQLMLAGGSTLAQLGLSRPPAIQPGCALQARINLETMTADAGARPAAGTLAACELPSGRGLRVDGFGYAGYRTSLRFDALLAKLIVRVDSGGVAQAAAKAQRALAECRIEGVATNLAFLQALLAHPEVRAGRLHTRFVETHIDALLAQAGEVARRRYVEAPQGVPGAGARPGARIDPSDPLGVLVLGRESGRRASDDDAPPPGADDGTSADGLAALRAPMQGTVVSVAVAEGERVRRGQPVLVLEAMKMEHAIEASQAGVVRRLAVGPGDTVLEDDGLAWIEPLADDDGARAAVAAIDPDAIRADLAEVLARQAKTRDASRPDAVAKRRALGRRTARENLEDLCDAGSFVEYGSLAVAGRRGRNTLQELIDRTPADGLVMGIGRVNGDRFADDRARCVAMSYDYTVLAGTQGLKNHEKKDRMFELAERWRLPLVLFAEGGGGRPGDTDTVLGGWLNTRAFELYARLSGLVPLVGIVSGRCFAGNAVLAGCCDVIIATEGANLGMGGPAMIEGGGLGVYRPEEVGPMAVQVPNGVVDVLVADDAAAVRTAKQYLSYFQGPTVDWSCADQRLLRTLVPENRLRVYDVRRVIDTLADTGSVLELRAGFGAGMVTALVRIEGRPIGLIANNPMHLGGAIDSDGADKAARFMQLCDAFDLPILTLCDTPGNMVGPDAERTALVRHCCRLYVTAASVDVPIFTVVLRKAYGLGAQGVAGGSFCAPTLAVAWPSGEFGGMGLEGAVKLGYRNELAAIEDPAQRRAEYERRVAELYDQGKALSTASLFEIDDVIDPLDTRRVIVVGLRAMPARPVRTAKKRPFVDTW
jgi:acetyl/propionyl-CoA carboxylase alpha subunit/acetyl-CoA carboxylase carboxyltransferase component